MNAFLHVDHLGINVKVSAEGSRDHREQSKVSENFWPIHQRENKNYNKSIPFINIIQNRMLRKLGLALACTTTSLSYFMDESKAP